MIVVWFICTLVYWRASEFGLMGPSSPIIQANEKIANACRVAQNGRETLWTICESMPQEYTTFFPPLYSLDLILPLVDLQQDNDWSPIVMKPDGVSNIPVGHIVRAVMWFEVLFGWVASLLVLAVVGNLVKKD
jgi:hypothetical protein